MSTTANTTEYGTFFGSSNPTTSISGHEQVLAVGGTAKNLRVHLSGSPGSGGWRFTIYKNGTTATTLTCSVLNTATDCADLTNTVTFNAGDTILIQIVTSSSGATTGRTASWAIEYR